MQMEGYSPGIGDAYGELPRMMGFSEEGRKQVSLGAIENVEAM